MLLPQQLSSIVDSRFETTPFFVLVVCRSPKLSHLCSRVMGMDAGDPDATAGLAAMPIPDDLAELAPGPQLSAVLAGLDPLRLTGHQLALVVAARNRQIAYEQSHLLVALRELGHAPPKERAVVVRDKEQNPFATVEAAFSATWTQYRAEQMVQLARFTLEQVPALGPALAAGRLDLDKVKVFHTLLVGVVDEELMRRIVDLALPGAAEQTTGGLRASVQRLLARLDPRAIGKRRERDHNDRGMIRHREQPSGLVTLVGRFCDPAAATAAYEHVDAIAQATHKAGDPLGRSMDQLRADIFCDLLAGVDPVQAGHATPAQRKGVINVHVNLAALIGLRGLTGPSFVGGLTGIGGLGGLTGLTGLTGLAGAGTAGADTGGAGTAGAGTAGADTGGADTGGAGTGGEVDCATCSARFAELADLVDEPGEIAGYGPLTAQIARETAAQLAQVGAWRYAVDDDGQLVAEGALPKDLLPQLIEQMHRWAIDASAGADGRAHYRPSAAQITFVRARDRRCQAPGCRVPAARCEIDHRIPWHRGGPTFIDNGITGPRTRVATPITAGRGASSGPARTGTTTSNPAPPGHQAATASCQEMAAACTTSTSAWSSLETGATAPRCPGGANDSPQ